MTTNEIEFIDGNFYKISNLTLIRCYGFEEMITGGCRAIWEQLYAQMVGWA